MTPITFTDRIMLENVVYEDSGIAAIATVFDKPLKRMFVKIHSWDTRAVQKEARHPEFRALIGKRVRVTIEVLDA